MSFEIDLLESAKAAFRTSFDATLAILVEGRPTIVVDGHESPPSVTEEADFDPANAACTWRVEEETLSRVFDGERAFTSAFLSGRLEIDGDMAVMARLEMEKIQ